jgi:hypothetical protein
MSMHQRHTKLANPNRGGWERELFVRSIDFFPLSLSLSLGGVGSHDRDREREPFLKQVCFYILFPFAAKEVFLKYIKIIRN